jgi:hypothetical protein
MRNSNTVDSLRLRETIADFELTLNSLGFKKPPNKEFGETSASDIQKFLENKIRQQNQEYLQKNTRAIEKSGGYSNAQSKSSDLNGYTDKDQKTQINNLLKQAVHNQGKGSFKERNASALGKTGSLFKKALSSTSISSGGNHPQQQKSTLQKSQSLSTQNIGQKAIGVKSRRNHKDLKKPNLLINRNFKKQKSKEPIMRKFFRIFTFKKTKKETQNNGTSRDSAKPIKVKADQLSNNKLTQGNSSFASSRGNSSTISRQNSNSNNRSQSFGSIASRNQSLSQSRSNSSRGNSFSSQGSLGSRSSSNPQTSKVNQSRSGGGPRR